MRSQRARCNGCGKIVAARNGSFTLHRQAHHFGERNPGWTIIDKTTTPNTKAKKVPNV